jgi:hypothetical protein
MCTVELSPEDSTPSMHVFSLQNIWHMEQNVRIQNIISLLLQQPPIPSSFQDTGAELAYIWSHTCLETCLATIL